MGLHLDGWFKRRQSVALTSSLAAAALLATACGGGAPAAPKATEAPSAKSAAATTAAPAGSPAAKSAAPAGSPAAASAGGAAGVTCAEMASQGPGGQKIVIGADGSLTGASATFGIGMKRGIEICLKEFNDAGGYKGSKVEIPILDDEVKPEKAVNNITRFIQQDKVVGIIAPVNSGNALAFIPKTEEAGIPVIVPISTSVAVVYEIDKEGKIIKPKKYTFRVSMQDDKQVEKILAYAKAQNWDAIGLMHDTSGYGQATGDTARQILAQQGIKILATQTYNIGDQDMTSQLTQMKNAGVKQILNFGLGPEDAKLLLSAEKIAYKPLWSGAWGWIDPQVPQLAGKELANGIITVASFTIDQSPAAAEFHDKMMKTYNEDAFPITSAQAYDATKMMLTALAKAGPDPEKIRDAIENLDGFKGVTAIPAKPYSASKHDAIDAKDIFIATWKDGNLVKLQ